MLVRICFDNVQTSNLLYYDPDFKDDCFNFCQKRDIDCLPALDDPMKFYRKTETGFCEAKVMPERMVDSHTFIFEKSLVKKFHSNPLLFVYSNDELTGVVHFSDYNRPTVAAYLFNILSSYEKSLRKLLIRKDMHNKDMLDYFYEMIEIGKDQKDKSLVERGKREIKNYERNRIKNDSLPAFEKFNLRDLIGFTNNREISALSEDINELRNSVMHVHEFVNMEDANRDDYIYDFATFEKFFERVRGLLLDHKKVNNRIAFLGES